MVKRFFMVTISENNWIIYLLECGDKSLIAGLLTILKGALNSTEERLKVGLNIQGHISHAD